MIHRLDMSLNAIIPHTEQKKALDMLATVKYVEVTSTLNSTPPMGVPKVATTPAAAAAASICLFTDLVYSTTNHENRSTLRTDRKMGTRDSAWVRHAARFIKGPSLPTESPAAMEEVRPIILPMYVRMDKKR